MNSSMFLETMIYVLNFDSKFNDKKTVINKIVIRQLYG